MSPSRAPYLAYTRHFFADHQDYSAMVKERFGVEFESIQLSHGSGSYFMDCFEMPSGGLWIGRTQPSQAEYSEFQVPDGYVMVSACLKKAPVYCNGVRTDSSSVFVYPAGRKFRAMYPKGWDGLDVLATVELVRSLNLVSPALLMAMSKANALIASPCGDQVQEFVKLLSEKFATAASSTSAQKHQELAADAVELTSSRLCSVLDAEFLDRGEFGLDTTRRADIVARATDFVSAHLEEELSAEKLAKELGISYRLLGYAFQDALNISPYQFILARKLHAVRDRLKISDVSINSVANDYGFSTPSRFRRHYSRLFGELPSETRQASTTPWR